MAADSRWQVAGGGRKRQTMENNENAVDRTEIRRAECTLRYFRHEYLKDLTPTAAGGHWPPASNTNKTERNLNHQL